MLYEIKEGSVSLGGQSILSRFHFYIRGREKMGLVGRNGAGKTSLLRLIAGQIDLDPDEKVPDAGIYRARDFSIGFLPQEVCIDPMTSAYQTMVSSDRVEGPEALRLFTELGFAKDEAARPLASFSGGQQKKILLIATLLTKPDLLLLDEPTNHLDLDAVAWLEDRLIAYPGAILLVSHDRYFLDRVTGVTWELEAGKTRVYPGNYSAYRRCKREQAVRQLKSYQSQQEEIARLKALIERFKHKPRKAAFARSRKKILDRMQEVEKPREEEICMDPAPILPARRGDKWVYVAEDLQIGYEKALHLVNFKLRRGSRIGLIGPNGSGKSTFLKTLAGQIPALSGRGTLGASIDPAYFDQFSAEIRGEMSLGDYFRTACPDLSDRQVRQILASYLFVGADLAKPVDRLSGGERARLVLATLLTAGPNLLLLDEPTNNMDIPAMESLERILRSYEGTLLVASHDRYFLQQVTDSLLVFGEAIQYYPFDYDHYRQHRDLSDRGMDPAAIRTDREQKMIEDLRAVPKKAYLPRAASFYSVERDWDYARAREAIRAAEDRLSKLTEGEAGSDMREIPSLEDYMFGAWEGEDDAKAVEDAEEELTKGLTDWYDLWLQDHPDAKE